MDSKVLSASIIPLAFLLLVVCFDAYGLESQTVTDILQKSHSCHGNPGMAVAVVKNGQTIYSNGFGVTDLATNNNVTEDTLFSIASITKSFAAALFVKLLYQNTNLTLDTKVNDFLGDEFVMPDKWRTEETTMLDLLSHKTAMLSNNRIRFDNNFTRDTLMSRLHLLPSNLQFRVDYIYNNIIYGLVGRMTELLAGGNTKWEELVAEHLFKPLGMDKSTFTTRLDFSRDDYAHGYFERDGHRQFEMVTKELSKGWAEICASGSIKSSVKEMTKYLKFHLTGGKSEKGDQVMNEDLMKKLHEPRYTINRIDYLDIQKPTFPITAYTTGYALGLRTGTYRGLPMISHTGTTMGYAAYMALLPTEQIGVIAVFSGDDAHYLHRTAAVHFLLDNALGETPYLNETTICSFPYPWITKDLSHSYRPQPSNISLDFKLQEYLGQFSNKAFGNVQIEYNDTLQNLVMIYGWGRWELVLMNETNENNEQRFYGKGISPVNPPDTSHLYFIPHPHDVKNNIVGIRATSFETKLPPIFCKHRYTDICEDIVSQNYPKVRDVVLDKPTDNHNCPNNGCPVAHLNQRGSLLLCALVLLVVSYLYIM